MPKPRNSATINLEGAFRPPSAARAPPPLAALYFTGVPPQRDFFGRVFYREKGAAGGLKAHSELAYTLTYPHAPMCGHDIRHITSPAHDVLTPTHLLVTFPCPPSPSLLSPLSSLP